MMEPKILLVRLVMSAAVISLWLAACWAIPYFFKAILHSLDAPKEMIDFAVGLTLLATAALGVGAAGIALIGIWEKTAMTRQHTHFIPLPTSAAGPMLASLRLRMQKAEASHRNRGPARKALIHATARHLAFEVAVWKSRKQGQPLDQVPTVDLFGEAL